MKEIPQHIWQAKIIVKNQPCANIGMNVHKELGKLVISIVSIAAFDPAISQADANWASSAVRALANNFREYEVRGISAEESGYSFHDKAFKLAGFKKVEDNFGRTLYWSRNA